LKLVDADWAVAMLIILGTEKSDLHGVELSATENVSDYNCGA